MKMFDYREKNFYPFAVVPIFIWMGFVCSISFMEAWLKFRAPYVTLPVGLSIGRLIFTALNRVEWGLAVVAIVLLFLDKRRTSFTKSLFLYIPVAILILQTWFLLPSLNERAESIIQGAEISPSLLHFYFIFFELMKVLSLFVLGINLLCARGLAHRKKESITEP